MKVRLLPILLVWFALSISLCWPPTQRKSCGRAAQTWLGQIDAGNYGQELEGCRASYFQGAVSEKGWTDALTGARKPLGPLVSRKPQQRAKHARSLPGAPDGQLRGHAVRYKFQ